MGRPSKLTPKVLSAIVTSISNCAPKTHAIGAAGISRQTFYAWIARGKAAAPGDELYEELYLRTEEAWHAAGEGLVKSIKAHGEKHWQALAWIAERTRPKQFALLDRTSMMAQQLTAIEKKIAKVERENKRLRAELAAKDETDE